ncbi:MAG TPA: DUF4350 domain-containing protein [Draconibacterium sp.]|nr:DUF4350 domain-containing protein [Draconibacterium sp.]
MKTGILTILIIVLSAGLTFSQQVADTTYNPIIHNPEYQLGKGPVIFIDEGHHNFHTKEGRYKAFAILLERDGYKVEAYKGALVKNKLSKCKILVISNALNEKNVTNWVLPTPSAFTDEEIKIVKEWVTEGGSLFLIADHMPMAGAAKNLAAAFEFNFYNGFALDTISKSGPAIFKRSDATLAENEITNGRNAGERVTRVASFTGQAFKLPEDATPILKFNENFKIFLPDTAWQFNKKTKRIEVDGWSQGAYKKYGKGKVVVFGEAAMFSAQLAGPQKIKAGMNTEVAKENYQLLLNIIHWLD